jgi:hypothetical protein
MRRLLTLAATSLLSVAAQSNQILIAGTHVGVTPDKMSTYGFCLNVITYETMVGTYTVKLSAPNRSEGVTFNSASAGDNLEGRELSFEVTPQKKRGKHLITLSGSAERLRHVYITLWYGPAGERLRTYNIRLSEFVPDDEKIDGSWDSNGKRIDSFGDCKK